LMTESIFIDFMFNTTPSIGILRISGFENFSKWFSNKAEE